MTHSNNQSYFRWRQKLLLAVFLGFLVFPFFLSAQCVIDCSAPELQDMTFNSPLKIPAPRTDLVAVIPNADCLLVSVSSADTDNGGAGCTTDTLFVTRTYTAIGFDQILDERYILTCEQVFTIVSTAMSCSNLVNVSLDETCEAEITACLIINSPKACCKDFDVMVADCPNPGDPGCDPFSSNIIDGTYLGDTLYVKAIDTLSGATCWGRIYIEDKMEPILVCGADTVDCTDNISPDSLGFPLPGDPLVTANGDGTYIVSGNACDSLTLSYRDRPGATSCFDEFGQIIYRDWAATDLYGNQIRCTDTIFIRRGGLADIIMPPNYDGFDQPPISCTADFPALPNGFPDTSFTGAPTGMGCFNILVNYSDDPSNIYDVCGGTRKLVRRWTFLDWCTGAYADSFQIIKIEDANPPKIICPGDMTFPANDGHCRGSLELPRPTITDSCSGTYYTVSLDPQRGTLTQIDDSTYNISNLDTGTYIVSYFAYDSCGNSDTCMFNLTIEDQFPPQAICDSVTVAPLNIDGVSRVPAASFDDGSYDDCNDVFFKVRRMTTGECNGLNGDDSLLPDYQEWFDDTLKMCCDDVGSPVLVIFRVYDVDPGPGPVDESRHLQGGDLFGHFSDCMVTARTQDKVMPSLTVPADMTVNCNDVTYDLNDTTSMNAAFGSAIFSDDCGNAVLTQSATASGTCPSDTITRAFLVTDDQNNQKRDTQRIVVETTGILTSINQISFPSDLTLPDCRFDTTNSGSVIVPVGNSCSLITSEFTDDTTYQTDANTCPYYIDRTWTVIEVCPVTLNWINGPYEQVQRITIDDTTAPITSMQPGTIFTFDANGDPNASFTFTGRELDSMDNNNTPRTFDNCTPYSQLKFHFTLNNLADSFRTIDCTTPGREINVDFRISDECGTTEIINAMSVTIQIINCPTPIVAGGIIGKVLNQDGEGVDEVLVHLSDQAGNTIEWETGADGSYRFPDLIANQSYTVKPVKQGGTRNGVSTYDLVMISKHVTGQQMLPTPYQRIAADVNSSGNISTFDIVELRKVILYINADFPQNDSWRFVEEDFVFPASDPFSTTFPEVFEVDALQHPMAANFVAMKVGDVNGSAQANAQSPAAPRSYAGTVNLEFDELMLKEGQEYQVPIRSADIRQLSGFEFALQFDPHALEYLGMEPGKLPNMSENNIGDALLDQGVLITSWHQVSPFSMDDDEVLFYLNFRAKDALPLHKVLHLNTDFTETEAYRTNGDEKVERLQIHLATKTISGGFALFQNQPNPFRENTLIGFSLPEATKARLTIYDVSGRMVKVVEGDYDAGYHEIELQPTELGHSGILYYRLDTPLHSAVKKMTVLD